MPKELWIFRHSHKLSYFPQKWKKHPRFKENPFDEPLTPFGMKLAPAAGKELVKKSKDLDNITTIYCSPFTRCIQTAIQIIKSTGKPIKITVVYDLGESILGRPVVEFQGDKIKMVKAKSIPFPGTKKKWTTTIDKKMSPTQLKKRFPGYITKFIKSKHGVENWEEESKRMFKAMKTASKNVSTIIVGHAHTIDLGYNYFAKPKIPVSSYTFGGPENVCTMMGFNYDKKWKMIYSPKVPLLKSVKNV